MKNAIYVRWTPCFRDVKFSFFIVANDDFKLS